MSEVDDDEDNPVWTDEDFARSQGPEHLPAHILAAFPETVARLARDQALRVPVLIRVVESQSSGFRIDRLAA